ncbi:CRE-NHR-69 protein [Aphelenchoides avenae]|nr:CRE-NHR-69 protein [Aphelenchus avenae]
MNCAVCRQPNASKHYGSVCCSGCKGFFRRTVRDQRTFKCQFESRCDVTKEFRNCCRACRYTKCVEVGLNPRLVCSDRGPIARNRAKAELTIKAEPVDSLPEVIDHVQPTTSAGRVASLEASPHRSSPKLALALPSYIPTRDLDDLPLGAKRLIPLYDSRDAASVATYFISAERYFLGLRC